MNKFEFDADQGDVGRSADCGSNHHQGPFFKPAGIRTSLSRNRGFAFIELILVIVIIGVLAAMAISYLLGHTEMASRMAMISDLNVGYETATLYAKDNLGGSVTLDILKDRGYVPGKKVTLTVVDGRVDNLRLMARHPGFGGVYMIDHVGRISRL